MKVLTPVLMFLLIGLVLGQDRTGPSEAPGVVVVENDWRKVVRNPALDDDPFRASRETIELENAKREAARINQVLRDLGREQIPPPTQSSTGIRSGSPHVTYVYEAKIRNTGSKVLRTVVWHYAFFEADEEVGRTSCTSKVNVQPGKTANIMGISRTLPIRVVDVSKSGKELKGVYAERVVITRLEYSDNSFWERPAN